MDRAGARPEAVAESFIRSSRGLTPTLSAEVREEEGVES